METDYRDPERLAGSAILWIRLWLVAQVSFGLACLYQITVLSGLQADAPMTMTISPPEAEVTDMIVGLTGVGTFVLFWVSGILVLRWIYRVNANAHTFADSMSVSPGWNVGWFFVPLANLLKPYQGIRETWQVSQGRPNWPDEPVPALLRWWWALWLITNFIDNISLRMALRSETVRETATVDGLNLLSAILSVPLGFLLIRLVRRLSESQTMVHSRRVFS